MPRRREPHWISFDLLLGMHQALIAEHGGSSSVRDAGRIESALDRPRHRLAYEPKSDLATLAAGSAFGLAKNHGFIDGNKRVAFAAAAVFLILNGLELIAKEPDVVFTMEAVAAGRIRERALADWIRSRIKRSRRRP